MLTVRRVAIVGSRKFSDYEYMRKILGQVLHPDDELVSGGAVGADSMAQRYAKETGRAIHIYYPNWLMGRGAGFERNRKIVENSDLILAFYAAGMFQRGGTYNTIDWAQLMDKEYMEFMEEEHGE